MQVLEVVLFFSLLASGILILIAIFKYAMSISPLVFIAVSILLVYIGFKLDDFDKDKEQKRNDKILTVKNSLQNSIYGIDEDFRMDYSLISLDYKHSIMLDISGQKICVTDCVGENRYEPVVYNPKQILDVKITQYNSNVENVVNSAIVGGLLLGPVGAIYGGLAGQKGTNVHKVELELLVNDFKKPRRTILCLDSKKSFLTDSEYLETIKQINHLLDLINLLKINSNLEATAATTGELEKQ